MELSLTGLPLPIILRPLHRLSDEELLDFSRRNEPYRIERNAEGEIIVMTPVGYDGGRRESYVLRELDIWAEADGKGEANGPNAGFNLPDGSTLSPDASWTATTRLMEFTKQQREKYLPLCPDFIVGVRSSSDVLPTLQAKMETWIANGARLAWLIDPYAANVAVYRTGQATEIFERPEVMAADGPVAGFRLAMARLWA